MMRYGWVALGVVLASFAACVGDDAVPNASTAPAPDASTDAAPVSDSSTAEAGSDAIADAPEGPRCDPTKPFGAPNLLAGGINTPDHEQGFTMSSDELVAVIVRNKQFAPTELRYVTRASRSQPFGTADFDKVGALDVAGNFENGATLGSDGVTLYFHRSVTSPITAELLRFTTRGTRSEPFAVDDAVFVDLVSLPHGVSPKISRDGLRLYWTDIDEEILSMAVRTTSAGAFAGRKQVGAFVGSPVLSKDQLTLYYVDPADGTVAIRTSTRVDVDASFLAGTAIPVLGPGIPQHITDDDCILYLSSLRTTPNAPGGAEIYEARRPL